eukprot:gb/GECH01008701.1/.p1 GENE.gb/GECH01008701.1/~~gb/GECH01008701.1/.p1  ORF type:complete len:295 (+),score=55.30 gb/GECH01008701.1/:1-885(+)
MSGDVGKRIPSCPGYQGYIPSGSIPPVPSRPMTQRVSPRERSQRHTSSAGAPPRQGMNSTKSTVPTKEETMPSGCETEQRASFRHPRQRGSVLRSTPLQHRSRLSWLNRDMRVDDPAGSTTYRRDHDLVNTRIPTDTAEFPRQASTAELADGTAKTNEHIPGYTGHVPAHGTNAVTVDFTRGNNHNNNDNDNNDNDNRSRNPSRTQRLPHFGMESTYRGTYREHGGRLHANQRKEGSHPKVNAMEKEFFAQGGTSDGKASAQKYYLDIRPAEGMPSQGGKKERERKYDILNCFP